MLLAWLLLIGGWSSVGCQAQVAPSLARRLLSTAFFPLRHPQTGQQEWLAAREFTERYLKALGLNVTRQVFMTTVLFDRDVSQLVEGVNLISLIPGRRWNTQDEDDILLVVAHYDSDVTNLGVRPGSGMVALLEVARRLQELRLSDDVQMEHTVVLAACDLLTTAHTWGKAGDSGLEIFVRNYLNQLLNLRSSIRFRGAVILDSVISFNSSYDTQTYPEGFAETFPGVVGDSMGDFVGAVGRDCSERVLMNSLQNNWQRGPGRLLPLLLAQQPPDSQALYEMLRQGQTALWNRVSNGVVSSLPAVMLTDTGRFRLLPPSCQTSNSACTPGDIITDDSMKFFNQTVDAVTNTILQLQGSSGSVLVGWLSLTSVILTLTILN